MARARLNELERARTEFWISRQVLREFLATTTRLGTIVPAPPLDSLLQAVRRFEADFKVADEDAAVTSILIDLLKSRTVQGKQIHDANIVATMHRFDVPFLLTHNTADFARYVPGIHVLPLISDPSANPAQASSST